MNHQIVWRALSWPGAEHVSLREGPAGLEAEGVAVALDEGAPMRVHYRLVCDREHRTRELDVSQPADGLRLSLRADGEGRWADEAGRTLPELDGCIDVDVAITPLTNTLPVRRLGLRPGEASDVRVVYVEVPGLRVRPARQRYHCLRADDASTSYRYESGDFSAELTFDAQGFVRSYGDLWVRCEG
jgi:uncharacterized protein